MKKVEMDGVEYTLSSKQMKLLDCVLPENYDEYEIEGVKFTKFNEDGNRLDQKHAYEKYIAEDKKRAVVDSFDYVPEKITPIVDNDLRPEQIKGEYREIEDALDYEGDDGAYEELEDDFFSKLLQNDGPAKKETPKQIPKGAFKKKEKPQGKEETKQVEKPKPQQKQELNYWDKPDGDDDEEVEEISDDMLEQALREFENNEETSSKHDMSSLSEFSVKEIESREDYMGRDGELDWRVLTRKEKKMYMKTKEIREFYDEVREREIEEKIKGKKNVTPEEMHLKQYIEHIPYEEDHVMQKAIEKDLQTPVNMDQESDYEIESEEDDIISYKQKTSIICTNLAMVEEPAKRKNKKKKDEAEEQEESDIKRVKVIPEKRDRKETKEERKQRKQKLKEMKKQKRTQKKEFMEQFESEQRKHGRKDNNPFHKVSCVKII